MSFKIKPVLTYILNIVRYICVYNIPEVSVTQSCPTLCDLLDYSPPSFPVHGLLQARTLERVAIPFSRGFSQSRDQTQCPALQVILYSLSHQRSKYQERENIKKNQTNSGAEEYNN